MTKDKQPTKTFVKVVIVILGLVLFVGIGTAIFDSNQKAIKTSCEKSNKVYDGDLRACRDKTISEKFTEQCKDSYNIGERTVTCAELKNKGLERAFIDKNIKIHNGELYEGGTMAEIVAGKQAGDYCLSAQDAWGHIGETRCVVFRYEYLVCSNGYCFLDEKKDFTNGFVAFFGRYNMYSWDTFSQEYQSGVSNILVCGQIYLYQGHPEIRITDVSKQVIKNPTSTNGAYAYTCKSS